MKLIKRREHLSRRVTSSLKILCFCWDFTKFFKRLLFMLPQKIFNVAKAWNFTKSNTPTWVCFKFFNCTQGTKSRKASHTFNTKQKEKNCTFEKVFNYIKLNLSSYLCSLSLPTITMIFMLFSYGWRVCSFLLLLSAVIAVIKSVFNIFVVRLRVTMHCQMLLFCQE